MAKVSANAKSDFAHYEQLLLGKKFTNGGDIYITEIKPTNVQWKLHRSAVDHDTLHKEPCELHTEVHCKDTSNFKFLIFARHFMPGPLANYDSAGITHRNKHLAVPLPEQFITTPHFNRYDAEGRSYAYKTKALTNPESLAELAQIGNCVIHVYDEFNILHEPAGYPTVHLHSPPQGELFPLPDNDDPLAHVPEF